MTAPTRRMSRRERRAQAEPQPMPQVDDQARRPGPLDSLVAAAVNVKVARQYNNLRWGATDWQQEAWLHYHTCPEFKAGISINANSLSRARLIGVEVDPATGEPGTQPTSEPTVSAVVSAIFGGPGGQGQALAAASRHLNVAGDGYVFVSGDPDTGDTVWEVLGTNEVSSTNNGRTMNVRELDGTFRPLADDGTELLIRIWRASPDNRWDADSPSRALLPVLRELAALSAMVSATVKSRLASAGILWIPEEITLPKTDLGPVVENSQVQASAAGAANAWLDLITEAMTAPIKDPDSAAAVVPMVATVKADLIEKIKHMEFGSDLDQEIEPLRQACIKRLAVGMNAPPEILLGVGDVNHWTGWLITEDFARAYLAPDLEIIADALTRYYLRPALKSLGIDPMRYAVYFDLDKLVPRQITVDNATLAYEAGLLAEDEYLQVLGFSTAQKALPTERGRRMITKVIESGNADLLAAMVPVLAQLFPGSPTPSVPALPAAPVRETVTAPPGAAPPGGAAPTAAGSPPALTPPPATQ